MSTPVAASFSGTAVSSGSVATTVIQDVPLAVSGTAVSSGSLTITTSSVFGGMDDWGNIPYVSSAELTDPLITGLVDITPRLGGGSDVAGAWQRISISATKPYDYSPGAAGKLYNKAAFARPTINTDSMPLSQAMQIAGIQVEQTPGQPFPLTDFPGINLLTTEQSSYEGRLMYLAAASFAGATYRRDNSRASCGQWSGHYSYTTPPAANTYTAVQGWGSYTNLEANNATYSQLIYNVPPGASPGTGTPQTSFIVAPMPEALVACSVGTTLVGSANMSMLGTPLSGGWYAEIYWFNSNQAVISTTLGSSTTITGNGFWDRPLVTGVAPSGTAYAAIGVRFTASSGQNQVDFWVDEHRLYTPQNLNPAGTSNTSPARPWHSPRLTVLRPRANRVNLCQNPGFYNDLNGWYAQVPAGVTSTWTRSTTGGLAGGPCGDFQIATAMPVGALLGSGVVPWTGVGTTNNQTGSNWCAIDLVPPNTQATYSAYVKTVQGGLPITIWADNGTVLTRGTTAAPGNSNWTQIYVTVTTSVDYGGPAIVNVGYAATDLQRIYSACPPPDNPDVWQLITAGSYTAWSSATTYSAGNQVNYTDGNSYQAIVANGPYTTVPTALEFYVDSVLAEASGQLGTYFDGFTPGSDYMWEPRTDTRPQTGESRSHYYQGKTVNQYRLDQALQRAIPVGGKYVVIYASPPTPQVG